MGAIERSNRLEKNGNKIETCSVAANLGHSTNRQIKRSHLGWDYYGLCEGHPDWLSSNEESHHLSQSSINIFSRPRRMKNSQQHDVQQIIWTAEAKKKKTTNYIRTEISSERKRANLHKCTETTEVFTPLLFLCAREEDFC